MAAHVRVDHVLVERALPFVRGNQERVQVLVNVRDLSRVADHFLLVMAALALEVERVAMAEPEAVLVQVADIPARAVPLDQQVVGQEVVGQEVAAVDQVKLAAHLVVVERAARAVVRRNHERPDARRSTTYAHQR
jgi:Iap family predicted aminopeptidase